MKSIGGSEPNLERRRLFTTFGFLVSKQGATAVIGLGYWAAVTHLFEARDVGLAAAAASTALLLAAVGALGIPLFLLAELELMAPAERRVVFTTGLAIAAMVVAILSIGTMALSPFLGESLRLIGEDPVMASLFVVGSVATMAGLTLDNAAIGLHRSAAQLWRGSLSSILKLACVGVLVLASTRTSTGLIFAWALALCVSFVVCIPMLGLQPTYVGGGTLHHRAALVHRFRTLSLQHHVLNLSIGSTSFIVPLLATLLISPSEVAYFSAAYLLSATMLIIPYLLALSLFAERAGDPGLLHRHVRRTLPLGLALSGALVLAVEIAAPYALRLFGPAYAANGTTALRILILVGPAYVIKDHYVSICRAQGRLSHASKVMAIGTALEVTASTLGGVFGGLSGICFGWAISASCEAVFLLPAVLHIYRWGPAARPKADPTEANSPTEPNRNSVSAGQAGPKAFVQRLDLSDNCGCGERPRPVECLSPHRCGGLPVVDDSPKGSGQRVGVAWGHQEPRHSIIHQIGDPSTRGRNNRPAECHCLEDHSRTAVGYDRGNNDDTGRLHEVDRSRVIEQSAQLHLIRKVVWRVFEHPSGQYQAGTSAQSFVRLDQHFDALVPSQVSDEHDRPLRTWGGLLDEKVVGNEIRDDGIGTSSGEPRTDRDAGTDRDEHVHVSCPRAAGQDVRQGDTRADHRPVPRRGAADTSDRPRAWTDLIVAHESLGGTNVAVVVLGQHDGYA